MDSCTALTHRSRLVLLDNKQEIDSQDCKNVNNAYCLSSSKNGASPSRGQCISLDLYYSVVFDAKEPTGRRGCKTFGLPDG